MLQIVYSNNIRVTGASMPLRLKITEALTIPNPAYVAAKRQRRPTWGIDQKLRLYVQDGHALVLPRGYSSALRKILADMNLNANCSTDFVEGVPVDFGKWNDDYEIRDYQTAAVAEMMEHNGVVVAPAGSGKTIIGMRYIHKIGHPTLWLTHTTDLMHQTKARAEATLGDVGRIGLLGDGKQDWGDGKLIIATVQTLRANPQLVDALNPIIGVVIIDEAHHFPANQFLDTAAKFKAKRIIGVTATPDRKDRLETYMYLGIGPLLYTVQRTDTQLIKPDVRFIYTKYADDPASHAEGTNVDLGGEDLDYSALLSSLLEDADRIKLIAANISKVLYEGPAIVIAESVRYCFKLEAAVHQFLNENGLAPIRTAVVHGGIQRYGWRVAGSENAAQQLADDYGTEYRFNEKARRWQVKTPQYTDAEFDAWQVTPTQRKQILNAVNNREIDVLFATQLAREGLDIPHLSVGHCVTPKRGDDYKATTGAALEQEIGRIMRLDPKNPEKRAVWYDYVDINVGIFKAQYYSRRRVYKRLGLRVPKKPRNAERDLIADFLGSGIY